VNDLNTDRAFSHSITTKQQNTRLDVFLAEVHREFSRSRIQSLVRDEWVTVNDKSVKPGYKLKTGDRVMIGIPHPVKAQMTPEEVPFSVLFEDAFILVLDKPSGIVVHPAPGHATGTLVHGLLKKCSHLSGIGGTLRPGIVHRLDRDTSGIMVIAKSDKAHHCLANQFQQRTIRKSYLALVYGILSTPRGEIDLSIARHRIRRKEMTVHENGRRALSVWHKLKEAPEGFSLVSVSIKTGRTHQIRVHFAHLGHPVVGDAVYGHGPNHLRQHFLKTHPKLVDAVKRQMLHARKIGFVHPETEKYMEFSFTNPAGYGCGIEGAGPEGSFFTNKTLT
jgi:23S rRNA pseudouridine1911/1915/1917 synthase